MGTSPYFLVYGQEPVFFLNLRIFFLKFMSGYVEDVDRVQIRLMKLLEMDENGQLLWSTWLNIKLSSRGGLTRGP